MRVLRIIGGKRLHGSVRIQGAKNSVLPILAASVLARGETLIGNCPSLSDVESSLRILKSLGCRAYMTGDEITVDSSVLTGNAVPAELTREMRSSVIFLGAVLSRTGEAAAAMPGGCRLGPRPIDLHLYALRALGAEVKDEDGVIVCRASRLKGGKIAFPFPSVGATENAVLAAVSAEGETVIENAAREPEITDLCAYLTGLGAKIKGAGTPVIAVEGAALGGSYAHRVIPDRIAAATYLAAAVSAGGEIELSGTDAGHLGAVTGVLSEMGCRIKTYGDAVFLSSPERLKAAGPIATLPYPGFPTDAQPPLMAASLKAEGETVFIENVFENRYRHVPELIKMGADIKTGGRTAVVKGVKTLKPAHMAAADLRGGAALTVAALAAPGISVISGLEHIDRGYDGLERVLAELGADIAGFDTDGG